MRKGNIFLISIIICSAAAVFLAFDSTDAFADEGATEGVLSKIDPFLRDQLAEGKQVDFFVELTEKADLSPARLIKDPKEKRRFIFETLRDTADKSQESLRRYLKDQKVDHRPFYITNTIYVSKGDMSLVLELAARPDVEKITANPSVPAIGERRDESRNVAKISQGIEGRIEFWEGNFMPGGPHAGVISYVKRRVVVFEKAKEPHGGPFWTEIDSKLVAATDSDDDGYFSIQLPEGEYSIVVIENGKYFANLSDGERNIFPVRVEKNKVSFIVFKIDYKSLQ